MKLKNRNLILMALIIAFALALRLIFFTGIDSSDSLGYSKAAYDIANKAKFSEGAGVGTLRLGIVFPVSILYFAFGVNEFSSNILALLASLGSIVLVYKIGKLLFNEKAGLLGAFLLSFFPFDVINSTRLNTDVTSAFFVGLSVYFFLKSEKEHCKNSKMLLIFSGMSLGVAYLIKELSLLIALFFAAYCLYNKKIKARYFLAVPGFLAVAFMEIAYFYIMTGNPFYRYGYISSDYATGIIIENSMQGRSNLLTGFFHYPYVMFTDRLLGLFYPFILIATVYCIANKKREANALLCWLLPILIYLNFGSLSLGQYIPIPATARFLSTITIPGMLLLSFFLLQNVSVIKKTLKPTVIGLLLITSIGYVYVSRDRFALNNERGIYEFLKSHPDKSIYSDEKTIAVLSYVYSYKNTDNLKSFNHYNPIKPEDTYALNISSVKDSYIVINREIISFLSSSKNGIRLPPEAFRIPEKWKLEKKTGEGENEIEVYYVS